MITLRAVATLAGLILPTLAVAQSTPTLNPLGYCQISAAQLASAVTLKTACGSVPASAHSAAITVETATVRWRDDGTPPTASIGNPISSGLGMAYTGPLNVIQFIAQSGSPVVNVAFYQ